MIPDNNWVSASELSIREFNALRGKLCSVIESMGLPNRQERAAVAQIKQYTYESQEAISQLLGRTDPKGKFRYHPDKVERE